MSHLLRFLFLAFCVAAQPVFAQLSDQADIRNTRLAQLLEPQNPGGSKTAGVVRLPARESRYAWAPAAAQWGPSTVQTSTYNAQGLRTVLLTTDSLTQAPVSRTTYSYTPAGAVVSQLTETWSQGIFQNATRWLNTYTTQGNLTEELYQQWQNGTWSNSYRYTYAYDSHGQETLYQYQTWTNDAWKTTTGQQSALTYDAAGRLLTVVRATWVPATSSFDNAYRITYTYAGASNVYNGYVYEAWTSGSWVNSLRLANVTRDAQDRLLGYESQNWNNGFWQSNLRYIYTYPGPGSTYVRVLQQYVDGEWVNNSRFTVSYDAHGSSLGSLTESWLNDAWALTSGYRYQLEYNGPDVVKRLYQTLNTTTRAFVNQTKSYYSDFQAIVLARQPAPADLAARVQLYPNPAAGAATLLLDNLRLPAGSDIEVLSATGQVVRRQRAGTAATYRLNLSGLPGGLYSIRLSSTQGDVYKQLLVQ